MNTYVAFESVRNRQILRNKKDTEDGSHLQGFFSLEKEFADNKQTDFLLWRTKD